MVGLHLDPETGLPWGQTSDGFDHAEPHFPVPSCPYDTCAGCGGYHCSWFCPGQDTQDETTPEET